MSRDLADGQDPLTRRAPLPVCSTDTKVSAYPSALGTGPPASRSARLTSEARSEARRPLHAHSHVAFGTHGTRRTSERQPAGWRYASQPDALTELGVSGRVAGVQGPGRFRQPSESVRALALHEQILTHNK